MNEILNYRQYLKDIFLFLLLLLISVFVRYVIPVWIGNIFFISLLLYFTFSRNENQIILFCFFLFLFAEPGYLFSSIGEFRLPAITLNVFGREIFFNEIFTIILVFKGLFSKDKQAVYYKLVVSILIFFSLILLLQGLVWGLTIVSFLKTLRFQIPLWLLLVIPNVIKSKDIFRLINLLFISSILFFSCQLIDILTGQPIASFLGEKQFLFSGVEYSADDRIFQVDSGPVRSFYGPFTILLSLIISSSLLIYPHKNFSKNYLRVIILITSLSIFLSATRGWIVALAVILLSLVIVQGKYLYRYVLFFLLSIVLITAIPKLEKQVTSTFNRVLTLGSLIKGDYTAEGTLTRLTERGPRVMKKFWEQPIIGFGFSDEYYKYADGHVGNQTLLLNGGIVGYFLYLCFVLFVMYKISSRWLINKRKYLIPFVSGLFGIIIIHSSSTMIFSYAFNTIVASFLSLFFLMTHYFKENFDNL